MVCGEHHKIVPNAQLRQQGINCPDLNSAAAAKILQLCRLDVIAPIGNKQGYCRETINNLMARSRA